MEEIESLKQLLRKRRDLYYEKCENAEKEQIKDHETLMEQLQALQKARQQNKDTISKNLNILTAHKHKILKLLQDSKDVKGLPISHAYQQQAISLFSSAIEFNNNLQDNLKILDTMRQENSINSFKIMEDIAACTKSVENELFKSKSFVVQLKTVKQNLEILEKFYFSPEGKSVDLNESIF